MKLKKSIKNKAENIKDTQARGAQRALLEELFNDLYTNRSRVYRMNFFRGIFLGLGSVIGGTIVATLLIYILSWFVDFPWVGEWFQQAKETINQR